MLTARQQTGKQAGGQVRSTSTWRLFIGYANGIQHGIQERYRQFVRIPAFYLLEKTFMNR
ncbi:MAG: hypothetical protein M1388_03200 [Thaumarchaeota archaeon]|nr:hypothetical protein [Nitrososphaerota archaeon]